MIIGFFGNVRQGKTLSAVLELYRYYKGGYKIYSNTGLSFPHEMLNLDYILDIVEQDLDIPDNSVFFIDEITVWLDSRVSGSKRNRVISYFLLQTGKMGENTDYGLILLYTAQFTHLIDKRLRSVTDIAIECEKIILKDNTKIIKQSRYIYKGNKSFSYIKVIRNMELVYPLYNTRKKIKAELGDRYAQSIDE